MIQWGNTKERIAKFKKQKQSTVAIHGGQEPDPVTGSIMPPIHQVSTYAQREPGKPIGEYEYTRSHNPTRRILEDCLALLEGGTFGLATSCGMSATQLILSLLKPGDEILCGDDVYGGTFRYFNVYKDRYNINVKYLDFAQVEKNPGFLKENSGAGTKMIWIETPTNPLMKVYDIEKISQVAKENKWIVVVDNTFATPINQLPLKLGADISMHSLSKYGGGHSDIIAGAVITNNEDLAEKLYKEQNNGGAILAPFDSWLMTRSLKTLPIRMKAHNENALKVAQFLEGHKNVEKVLYPGLESHPQYALAKKQMNGFGGMLSFYVAGGYEKTKEFCSKIKIFTLAESLGGVESMVNHPAFMTHASIPKEIREANGITDNLLRLSIGIEDLDDIIADLEEALNF